MNRKYFKNLRGAVSVFFVLLLTLVSCSSSKQDDATIVSIQTIDRNGFAETVSNRDRLVVYENVNFLEAQPYHKVMRVYKKNREGKSHSKLTSYHSNGGVWQYIEVTDNRANGRFFEWHENGKIKIEAHVIEGMADLNELSQQSWMFDKECNVWDEEGNLKVTFLYEKGVLENETKYYYPSGKIEKIIPYKKGVADGAILSYDEQGNVLEKVNYKLGKKEGSALASWVYGVSKYQEQYRDGLLINAFYFDPAGNLISQIENGQGMKAEFDHLLLSRLTEHKNGVPEGEVKLFFPDGALYSTYQISNSIKNGEEWEYYPAVEGELKPKLMLNWSNDQIQGMVKTWYKNGVLESQREVTGNKKHGLSLAYYHSGDLMLMEEYENDRIVRGSYYKKGETAPVSIIEHGEGVATLFYPQGQFFKKITYERSKPVVQ